MVWIKWIALALASLVALFIVLSAYGVARWNAGTRALIDRLEATRQGSAAS
jgi:hypothetical protein